MARDPRSIKFRDLVPQALSQSLAKPATVRVYTTSLRHVLPTLGHLPAGDITLGDVRRSLVEAREKARLSPKSLVNARDAVKLVLREAGVALPPLRVPQEPRELRALGSGQANRLIKALERLGGPEAHALLMLLATGVRLGELFDLTNESFDPLAKRLTVRGQKSVTAARVVDVPDWACRLFGVAQTTAPWRMRKTLAAALGSLGLRRIRLHDLRHTRFTHLLLSGAPMLYVSEQAGHSTPAYTMKVYGHVMAATAEDRRRWCNL